MYILRRSILPKMYIFLLSITYQLVKATGQNAYSFQALVVSIILFKAFHIVTRNQKQQKKKNWRLLRYFLKQGVSHRKDKSKGGMILLLLLMLIACAAILWVLWALGGIFALVLGIVFGVGILSLILRDS